MRARDIIRTEYGKSRNFMTEHVIEIGSIKRGRVAYELSSGPGIFGTRWIIGVTVVSCDGSGSFAQTKREHELSRSFSGAEYSAVLKEARAYIQALKES